MLDIETLGTTPGSQILSIGWCTFTGYEVAFTKAEGAGNEYEAARQVPKILASGQFALDLEEQTLRGLTADAATLKWWESQPDALAAMQTLQAQYRHTSASALDMVRKLWAGCDQAWANGPEFDFVLLDAYFRKTLDEPFPVPFWAWRQCRALGATAELVAEKSTMELRPMPEVAHDAGYDCVAQAKWMLNCRAALLGLPLPY